MKSAVVVANPRSDHQPTWGGAFAEGLRHRGWKATVQPGYSAADLVVMWSVRNSHAIAQQLGSGGQVCILERGYIGDRFQWTSVSFGGGLNGRGEFRGPHHDGTRFEKHFSHLMQPWHPWRDGYALLIGQVPGDMSIRGVNIDSFYNQSVSALKRHGWPDVRFRPHPKAGHGRLPNGAPVLRGSLEDAFKGAGVVMTYNSNTGVEAALAGRPVIAMDIGSMAYEVAGHQVTEIVTPDRTAWANALAWKQFTLDEIQSGFCAEAVGL